MLKDVAKVTFDQLDEFGIPYDEIHFGKPHADVYIDGKSVNPTTEFAKTLGTSLAHTLALSALLSNQCAVRAQGTGSTRKIRGKRDRTP